MATFDYNSIPAEKPASFKQIKYRVGNLAVAYLLNELGLNADKHKATNYKLFSQMGMALKTATLESPFTNGDVREMDSGCRAKHYKLFQLAYAELFCSSKELEALLLKDGLTPAKTKTTLKKWCKLTGKDMPVLTTTTRKKTEDDTALSITIDELEERELDLKSLSKSELIDLLR